MFKCLDTGERGISTTVLLRQDTYPRDRLQRELTPIKLGPQGGLVQDLITREMEILRMLLEGLFNLEIAQKLFTR